MQEYEFITGIVRQNRKITSRMSQTENVVIANVAWKNLCGCATAH